MTIKIVQIMAVVYAAPTPPKIGGTPQTGRNSCVNFSDVIH